MIAYRSRDQKHSSGNWNTMKQNIALSGVTGRDLLIHTRLDWRQTSQEKKKRPQLLVNKALRLKIVL